MIDFSTICDRFLEPGNGISLVLSKKRAIDIADRVTVRPCQIQETDQFQFAYRTGTQERHENCLPSAARDQLSHLFPENYDDCHCYTVDADYAIRRKRNGTTPQHHVSPFQKPTNVEHNRGKNYLIADGTPCPFLFEIGVMTKTGQVRAEKYHKFKQINRFLELVDDIVPELPSDRPIEIVDFGSGKSYLTFAVHHLLTAVYQRTVHMIGLDQNAQIVADCARIAERLQCLGLTFAVGTIADYAADGPLDLAISLHACDTATDDALAAAVRREAGVILAVPCCQHELSTLIPAEKLSAMSQHGLLQNRLAALATDALRSKILEICGYRTQVVEFIELEHTAKNVLIRARRATNQIDRANLVHEYQQLQRDLGISHSHLDRLFVDLIPKPVV